MFLLQEINNHASKVLQDTPIVEEKQPTKNAFYSSKAFSCFFGVTPSPFRLSTLRMTFPAPS